MAKRKSKDKNDTEQRRQRKRPKQEQKEKKQQINDPNCSQDDDGAAAASSKQKVFLRKKLELTISLLPSALGNVLANVDNALRLFLLKYSDGIGGILLAFENVKILSGSESSVVGLIVNELPHIHYRVSIDALVFFPALGSEMIGSVTESSFHSHLSLVVHHYFNASVSAEHLREADFEFDDVQLRWYWQDAANTLSKDDRIAFLCQKLYESGGIISIEGSKPVRRAKQLES